MWMSGKPQNPKTGQKTVTAFKISDIEQTKAVVEFKRDLQKLADKIHNAKNLDEILITLTSEIADLFQSKAAQIYVLDAQTRQQLVYRFLLKNEAREVRFPVSLKSVIGYVAYHQKVVNLKDAYDEKELAQTDENLRFDRVWDKKTNTRTKELLCVPIFFRKYLMGVLLLSNRINGEPYHEMDEENAKELAKMIGVGLYNQRRTENKFTYLLNKHLLTQQELKAAITEAGNKGLSVEQYLIQVLKVPKTEVLESLKNHFETPYAEFSVSSPVPQELLKGLKPEFMKKNLWVPLGSEEGKILVAIDNPHNFRKIGEIKVFFPNASMEFRVALKEDILDFITLFTEGRKEIVDEKTDELTRELFADAEETGEEEDEDFEIDEDKGNVIVKLINKIIMDAHKRGATDIHFEPFAGKQKTIVRIRVEGRCRTYQSIPYKYRNEVVSRLKIMSDLNIIEHMRPQEGKIKFKKYGELDVEIRVTVIPIQGGLESVSLHFLETSEPSDLDKIGFSEHNYKTYMKAIKEPYGIILISGPIGAGKIVTVHSTLKHLNKGDVKIWTAEDPVEIIQKGLSQVEVKPEYGLDFVKALRAILLADPDVVMLEEIKERETAFILVDAALKGHLVLSTLYANSAAETITRLLEMELDPYNFSNTFLAAMTQKQVYTLCKNCKLPYQPIKKEYEELVREYGEVDFKKDIGTSYSRDITLYKANGCDICNHTGYKGQMALHEILYTSEEMKWLIRQNASLETIQEQAIEDGMISIKKDGIQKIFKGHTDMREVYRVCVG